MRSDPITYLRGVHEVAQHVDLEDERWTDAIDSTVRVFPALLDVAEAAESVNVILRRFSPMVGASLGQSLDTALSRLDEAVEKEQG